MDNERTKGKEKFDPWLKMMIFEQWLTADENNELIGCEYGPERETEID